MTTDWIKIEPGCRMPNDGARVLVADGMTWCEAKLRGPGWYLESGARVTPTHWLPIVPPEPEDPLKIAREALEFYANGFFMRDAACDTARVAAKDALITDQGGRAKYALAALAAFAHAKKP